VSKMIFRYELESDKNGCGLGLKLAETVKTRFFEQILSP